MFQAIRDDGYHCVVKMYVHEYDDNWRKIPDFDSKGRDAVSQEEEKYKQIYPELRDYVWTEKLCKRHCLIVPLFEAVEPAERENSVAKVSRRYEECFLGNNFAVKESRVLWRHIGQFNDKFYLFSLSKVESATDEHVKDLRPLLLKHVAVSTEIDA